MSDNNTGRVLVWEQDSTEDWLEQDASNTRANNVDNLEFALWADRHKQFRDRNTGDLFVIGLEEEVPQAVRDFWQFADKLTYFYDTEDWLSHMRRYSEKYGGFTESEIDQIRIVVRLGISRAEALRIVRRGREGDREDGNG